MRRCVSVITVITVCGTQMVVTSCSPRKECETVRECDYENRCVWHADGDGKLVAKEGVRDGA